MPGTVFAALPFRIGDTYTDEKGAAALRALFATGLFKDVRIDIDNGVAVVIVEERPVIASIDFVGLKEFDKDTLIKSLKDFGIGEGLPFDKALADRAEQELKRQYLTRSLYGAEVVTTVTPHERNRVNVTFTMTEGERRARSARSASSATRRSREGTLKGLFDLNDGGWLNWYTEGRPLFARQAQRRPRDAARLLPEPRLPRVRRRVDAGRRSRPTSRTSRSRSTSRKASPTPSPRVKLEGDYLGKEDEFKTLVTIKPGRAVSRRGGGRRRHAPSSTASAPSAMPSPRSSRGPRSTARNGQVVVTLRRRPAAPRLRAPHQRRRQHAHARRGDSARVPPVRVVAGTTARKIKLSRDRVDRLGYFSEVNVDTSEVAGLARPGRPDDHDQGEADRQSARSAPASRRADKLSLTASIKQENVFGSGNYLGLEVNTSKYNRTLVLSTVDPYFTIDGISRAFDLYYRTTPAAQQPGRGVQARHAGRRDALRRAVQRVRHGLLRHRRRAAPRSRARPRCRTATSSTASSSARPAARCR